MDAMAVSRTKLEKTHESQRYTGRQKFADLLFFENVGAQGVPDQPTLTAKAKRGSKALQGFYIGCSRSHFVFFHMQMHS